jgi:hypothetical protein
LEGYLGIAEGCLQLKADDAMGVALGVLRCGEHSFEKGGRKLCFILKS